MTVMDTLFDADALHDREPDPPPGGPRLTPAQAAAVAERSRSLLVAANAGSGKTSVLVERFVRAVVDDGVEPGRILAITFTEKAAGELRGRLRARLLELGEREAAQATEGAWVSTIHGFCARLLRAHAPAAGLDPAFGVLDEPQAARLREEAFSAALADLLREEGEEAVDLAAAYRVDGLRRAIVEVHDALRSQGRTAPRLPAVAPVGPPVAEREELAAARTRLAADLADAGDGKRVAEARAALERCADLLVELESGAVPWPGRLAALSLVCGNAQALSTDACERYVAARDAFEQACADHHASGALRLLGDLLARYGDAYAAAKRAGGALDFDDLELAARDLLAAHPGLRAAWGERFALVMVDEFQDTNGRQLALLEALERDNLFVVGDALQSIYGFRHADVEIFRARQAALAQRGAALVLPESFRARPEILDALNAVFAPRFGAGFEPLRPAREPAGDAQPRVELLVTDTRGWEDPEAGVDLGDTLPRAQAWRHAEARLVAQRVRELVDAGDARPGDVALLVRATAAIPVYERALADAGLATLASSGRGFWSRQEVVDLVAYVTALANPLDELALLGALASPLAGVSLDGVGLARLAAREAGRDTWWALRAAFADGEHAPWVEDLEPGDRAALAAFTRRFAAERTALPRLALDEVLERAVLASGYDLHLLGLLGGPRRLANVDKLQRMARDFESAQGRDLRGLADVVASLPGGRGEPAGGREGEAPIEDPEEDAVRLMTVHAAKGLEFGTVVVADIGRMGGGGPSDLLVDGDDLGLRLRVLDGGGARPALAWRRLADARALADRDEEDRIVYVALTRARERLIVSGAANPAAWPEDRPGSSMLSWLGPALVPGLAERLLEAGPRDAIARVVTEAGGFTADVRLVLNAPATVGAALREEFRAPASAALAEPAAPAAADDADLAPAHPATGPASRALSYTALARLERCALRFHAGYDLGLPDVPAPRGAPIVESAPDGLLDARERGVLVHALVEELDLATLAAPSTGTVRDTARRLGLAADERDVAAATRLAAAFAATPLAERLSRARAVHREHEFTLTLGGPDGALLTGVLDVLAVEEDGTWLVADVKTDRVAEGADLAEAVARDYAIQRGLYALAALRAGASRVEVAYAFLERAGEPVHATFGPEDAAALEEAVGALAERAARGPFTPTALPHAALCATCPARATLCPHPRELTLRPAPVPAVEG